MKKLLGIAILIVCSTSAAWSNISIYLYSRYMKTNDQIKLKDIASVEFDTAKHIGIGKKIIPYNLYRDGFIDKTELHRFLNQHYSDIIFIYGNSTRVFSHQQIFRKQTPVIKIIQGQQLQVIVKKGMIRLEIIGKAMQNGTVGEKIKVKVRNNKIISGIILKDGQVEVAL